MTGSPVAVDTCGRALRVSVPDRCNFRCRYCMPRERLRRDHECLAEGRLLTFAGIARLAGIFVDLGLRKIRLTGGELLLRPGIERLVRELAGLGVDLALTTNGSLLRRRIDTLVEVGLSRVRPAAAAASMAQPRPDRCQVVTATDTSSAPTGSALGSQRGQLHTCLFSGRGHDLRQLVRGGATNTDIRDSIVARWGARDDRYSELRSSAAPGPMSLGPISLGMPRVEMSYISLVTASEGHHDRAVSTMGGCRRDRRAQRTASLQERFRG